MCPDMPGAEMRSRSASSEAVMPGFRLIWMSRVTWPLVTPRVWISRRSSRAMRSSTGRKLFARVPLPRAAESFVVLIINLVNYSNEV